MSAMADGDTMLGSQDINVSDTQMPGFDSAMATSVSGVSDNNTNSQVDETNIAAGSQELETEQHETCILTGSQRLDLADNSLVSQSEPMQSDGSKMEYKREHSSPHLGDAEREKRMRYSQHESRFVPGAVQPIREDKSGVLIDLTGELQRAASLCYF
jgi:hypothetical protein